MPYLAPEAAMPMTSCAPRLAERKARPVTQAGMERKQEVRALLHPPFEHPADANHEHEIDDENQVIESAQLDMLHVFCIWLGSYWAVKSINTFRLSQRWRYTCASKHDYCTQPREVNCI